MDILIYNDLDVSKIAGFAKICDFLRADDFKSAEVKKIDDNLYRAKLNRSDRILFSIYQYAGQKYALILEYLKSHDYENSRFLQRGVLVDEERIPVLNQVPEQTLPSLAYVNKKNQQVAWLSKAISFDDCQDKIYQQAPPMILIGSAGSGKTALLLEKLKKIDGEILYVTLSSFLVKNSQDLYYSHDYQNEQQNIDFFSFDEMLESIAVPKSNPISFRIFLQWYQRHVRNVKITESAHKLFEEFRGVLTGGVEAAYLSQDSYVNLGVKQSIYAPEVRCEIYDIFLKYLDFLKENNYHDSNVLSFDYVQQIKPCYDFVVVDEVQDLTTIQLLLILKMLRLQGEFLLCGDSNQIVHPNFFSWASVKTLFYKNDDLNRQNDFLHILQTNYRNSPQVTELANRILLLKQARFGSIDRESNYLVQSNGHVQGNIRLLHDRAAIVQELDLKTKHSTRFAVVVMRDEQKIEAQRFFQTPLVFSIQEAKGLEYENIILYNFISAEDKSYQYICEGVSQGDLQKELKYSRNKEKSDKSLEVYKFYINALYVALTRAVSNLYWIESNSQHRMLGLLGFTAAADHLDLTEQQSSNQDWQREAHKLELQGKQEQADRIRQEVLKEQKPDWPVYTQQTLADLVEKALIQQDKKAKLMLFEYAIVYENLSYLHRLSESGFNPAKQYSSKPEIALKALKQKYYMIYGHQAKIHPVISSQLSKFGLEFENIFAQTPLIAAVWIGDVHLAKNLISMGADIQQVDNRGFNPFLVAVQQATLDQKYAKYAFSVLYDLLKTDSLSVQIDGRLLKIQNHTMEFWMLHLMFVFMGRFIAVNRVEGQRSERSAIVAQQFEDAIAGFPKYIMPDRRKKRTYISGILSKNERNSNHAYSKKLFLRTQLGNYMLNPELLIKVQGEWKKVYQWLRLDENIVFFEPDYADSGEVIDRDLLRTAAWTADTDRRWEVIQARYQQERLDARRAFLREMLGEKLEYEEELKQKLECEQKLKQEHEQKLKQQLEHEQGLKQQLEHEQRLKQPLEHEEQLNLQLEQKQMLEKQLKHEQKLKRKFENEEKLKQKIEHKQNLKQQLEHERKLKQEFEQQQNLKSINELDQGTWTDPKTGLMWMRCSMGQTWDGVTAQGKAIQYSWDRAQKIIAEMNKNGGFAGYTDWWLPKIDTLKKIMRMGGGYNCPDGVLFQPSNSFGTYWSSSTNVSNYNYAWYVNFTSSSYFPEASSGDKNAYFHVRAVRGAGK